MFKKLMNAIRSGVNTVIEKAKVLYAWACSEETQAKAAQLIAKAKVVCHTALAKVIVAFKKGMALAVLTDKYNLGGQDIRAAFRQALAEVKKMDIDGLNKVIAVEGPEVKELRLAKAAA